MGTDINIKNKLAILNEGANITTDAKSIDFVGSGVNTSTVGGNTTVNIPGNSGNTTYYFNYSVSLGSVSEFSSVPTTAIEQVISWAVDQGVTEVAFQFETPLGVPNTTQIPAGLWQFFLHFNALGSNQYWIITPEVYKIDISNVETLLFTSDPIIVSNMPLTTTMYVSDGVFPATTLLATDRLLVKILLQNTGFNFQTLNFVTEGSQHYSVAFTTLNQVISGGSVTSVTGTAPIVSSGGTTPAISIPQATGSANGYLSSSDWSVFNTKQDAITLTTTGTSGASTLVGSTLNIPQYAGGLTYFTEAQSTTAPNATVAVDSLTAVSGTTNADMALLPKGTGAFIVGHIPDGTTTNGGKRGTGAIELMSGSMNSYSGAQGASSVAIGVQVEAKGANSIAIGAVLSSTGAGSIAIGIGNGNASSGANSFALNTGSASNTNSVALNGNASGVNSFASNNSTASGSNSIAMGGASSSTAQATATNSVAIGDSCTSDARSSVAFGSWTSTKGVAQRLSLGSFQDIGPYIRGHAQLSLSSSLITTTTNTASELVAYGGTAINLVLQNNEAIRVKGSIIGKQTASTNVACYDFDCVVVRGATAGSTILPLSNVNLVIDTITLDTIPTLTANTTLGGLSVKSGAKTTTTIKWSCRIDSTEVILA